jgi:riboflavin kinase/FMN adenylyltransferase
MHLYDLTSVSLTRPSIVTVGVFDGVHRGHRSLVERLVATAHDKDHSAVVLTFFPHPDVVLRGITGRYYLTPPEERARLLLELGVDVVITHPFNDELRHIRASAFVDQLLKHVNMQTLWATSDFAMGYQREGNIPFLREEGLLKGFTVETVDLVYADENGDRISSSTIRQALQNAQVTTASRYLGRPYRLSGKVVHGEKRGRKIGFPTANIDVWPEQILPQNGVYVCWAHLGDETFAAVTNIGNRPTFAGQDVTVEAHLLDFDRDIYDHMLILDMMGHIRPEMKFNGIEALIAQIHHDVQTARTLLG